MAVLLSIALLVSGCVSTTLIDSYPTGAYLYLDGEPVGKTPYPMTDSKIIGSCTSVKIEKNNFEPFYTTICRDEEPDVAAIVGGFFAWPLFFWAMKYKPNHIYNLLPEGSRSSAREYLDDEEESLDSLWKDKEAKPAESQSEEQTAPDESNKVLKLDEAQPISDEEFQQQKVKDE